MKNTETGEFELVLGNKQLLSGFFIVVILFGVFFTMGYIVGRNSSPSPRMAGAAESAAAPLQAPAPAAPQQSAAAAPAPDADPAAKPPETAAADPAAPAAGPAPQPQPTTAAAQAEPAKTAVAAPPPAAPAKSITEPAPGDTYLQVMAVKRPEAEVVAKTLRDKGFKTMLGPGPNELVRVLVGPFSDTTALGAAKANLENAGFHPIVRK